MLSAQTLERVSVAYRKGYYDGYFNQIPFCVVKPEYIKPFADFDYKAGYEAGLSGTKWTKIHKISLDK
jgi:hypothetical protein